ncbi:MAG: hypothetical protein PVH88_17595 [Ignavibacteria bacterium]
MKSQNIKWFIIICILILAGACKEEGTTELESLEKGEITLDLSLTVAKSLGLNIEKVYLEIIGPTGLNGFLTISDDTAKAYGTFTGLLPGNYNLEVVAYNSDNDTLATGSGSAEVKVGEITIVNIQMTLNTGLSITVNWGSVVFPTDHYLYVANEGVGGGNTILKILSDGSATIVGTGFNGPAGVAVHPETKDLFISDDYGSVYRIKSDGSSSIVISELMNPNGLAFDSNNRLLIAEAGGQITRINLETNLSEILATGFGTLQGIGEFQGDIFFTDNSGYVFYIQEETTLPIVAPAESNRFTTIQVVQDTDGGLTIDSSGNIYVCNDGGKIVRVTIENREATVLHENLNIQSRGLTLTPSQEILLVTNYNSNEVYAIDLITNSTWVFINNNNAQGLLNGPFGMAITNINFPGFVRPTILQ